MGSWGTLSGWAGGGLGIYDGREDCRRVAASLIEDRNSFG